MITVPAFLWKNVLAHFCASPKVERVAYLDGYELGEHGIVTTMTVPKASCEARWFSVSSDAMSQAGKHLRELGQVRLAQLHSHPGVWVEHSDHDDERAYSQRIGAISIVIPNYGRGTIPLDCCGVHVRDEHGWRMLGFSEAAHCLRIVRDAFDFRGVK